ncbi:demethoxyubiquinone hydroxylase family protein [Phenylobacterium sp.]|jgi:ubiquinone biosynthesis monooxygenase Coq7|uniref:demethoxyubiquinone hydroxylase family protein n=1 Tax=Phenylobacterium sp. TaxID=1871053 RepID=UPI002F9204AC
MTPSAPHLTRDQRLIRRILRVNHAGEHGAIAIYSAQIAHLGRRAEARDWLIATLAHERRHRGAFREAMPSRNAKPCRALGVWSVGGWVLGCLTALTGTAGVMACTAAVERTVHGHLQEQMAFLERCDPGLAEVVADVRREELEHLAYAEARLPPGSALPRLLEPLIAACTELLIATSTRGDSVRLRQALRAS